MTLTLELTAEEEDALLGEINGENQTPEFWARNALRYMLGLRGVVPPNAQTNGSGDVLEEPRETPVYVRRPTPLWLIEMMAQKHGAQVGLSLLGELNICVVD